jgi:hypothetical protein
LQFEGLKMPVVTDYEKLPFIGKVKITITGCNVGGVANPLKKVVQLGLLTHFTMQVRLLMPAVVFFKKLVVASVPVRVMTNLPYNHGGGELEMRGIFSSPAGSVTNTKNAIDAIRALNGQFIPEIKIELTDTDSNATVYPTYLRNCMCKMVGLESVSMQGVNVVFGTLGYQFGFATNTTNPNYVASNWQIYRL